MKLAQLIRAGMWILFLHRCLQADAKAEPLQDWTLDNGVLTVKLDLTRGGAIAYISKSGSPRNLVNSADEGRYIQQSYYAGQAMNRRGRSITRVVALELESDSRRRRPSESGEGVAVPAVPQFVLCEMHSSAVGHE